MKTTLNQILRKLMRKSDVIGTVYTGTKLVGTVPSRTSMKVASVTVPAGTYVITANTEWNEDLDVFMVSSVGGAGVPTIERGTMGGGGGASLSIAFTFDAETEIYVSMYHAHTEPVGIRVVLKAVRIK